MTRNYEIAFVLKEGEVAKSTIERIKENLSKVNAVIQSEDKMGDRDLAYIIKRNREKFTRAFYYFVKIEIPIMGISEFERLIKYDEGIIRYLLLKE